MTILQYLEFINVLETIEKMGYKEVPLTMEGLVWLLDDLELNFWSYPLDEFDEIPDDVPFTLVKDYEGNARYFELIETVTW